MTANVALPSRRSLATGLPRMVFGGGEVEHVVDDLEGEAEVASVLAELGFGLVAGAGNGRANCMETLKRQAVLR